MSEPYAIYRRPNGGWAFKNESGAEFIFSTRAEARTYVHGLLKEMGRGPRVEHINGWTLEREVGKGWVLHAGEFSHRTQTRDAAREYARTHPILQVG